MRIILICLLGSLLGCGSSSGGSSGPCSNSAVTGTWSGNNGVTDTLTLDSSCNFKDSSCSETGTYPDVTATTGSVLITIASTSGASGCFSVGQTSCSYLVSGTTLTLNCGSGGLTFTKQ